METGTRRFWFGAISASPPTDFGFFDLPANKGDVTSAPANSDQFRLIRAIKNIFFRWLQIRCAGTSPLRDLGVFESVMRVGGKKTETGSLTFEFGVTGRMPVGFVEKI